MGVWLVVTTRPQSARPGPALSALAPGEAPVAYTVMLRVVPGSQLEGMKQVIATDPIQALAGGSAFRFLELPDGSVAVCVGGSAEEDSPELAQLLGRFRQMSTNSGARPFETAQIQRIGR